MQGYLNISEASQLTGKHKDTIRRLIRQNPKNSNIMKGNKGEYLINRVWLENIYSPNEPHTAPATGETKQDEPTTDSGINNAMSAVIEALTAQLQAKDQQLERAQATIDKMASDYSTLLNQSQQLQGLLLPANTNQKKEYSDIKENQEEPQVYPKYKTPQSRVKNPTKQGKNTRKTTKKQTAKKIDSPKPEKSQKKRWWMR
jgi:hypothetical protein